MLLRALSIRGIGMVGKRHVYSSFMGIRGLVKGELICAYSAMVMVCEGERIC